MHDGHRFGIKNVQVEKVKSLRTIFFHYTCFDLIMYCDVKHLKQFRLIFHETGFVIGSILLRSMDFTCSFFFFTFANHLATDWLSHAR